MDLDEVPVEVSLDNAGLDPRNFDVALRGSILRLVRVIAHGDALLDGTNRLERGALLIGPLQVRHRSPSLTSGIFSTSSDGFL